MSGMNRRDDKTPGPIDRALDRDRDDRTDVREGSADDIREGMRVYGAGDRVLGTVERVRGDGFDVAGQRYTRAHVARVTTDGLYLRGDAATAGETRIPVAEERLNVGKRETELGEAQIRKTVTEEEQTVPVTLHREEVQVREEAVPERPLRPGEDAFNEGTIRVPVRGEEPVVAKEAVVTGEVVVNKTASSEERQVSDTVRKQRVDVDKAYQEARGGFEQAHTARRGTATDEWGRKRTFEQAEPHYRRGFTAGHDERYTGREFADVEPEMRREYETGTTTGTSGMSGTADSWEQLREEIRAGWDRARGR